MELKPRRNRIQLGALLLPGIAVFAIFTIYPIVKLFIMSFLEWDRANMFEHGFAGLANYKAVLTGQDVLDILHEHHRLHRGHRAGADGAGACSRPCSSTPSRASA